MEGPFRQEDESSGASVKGSNNSLSEDVFRQELTAPDPATSGSAHSDRGKGEKDIPPAHGVICFLRVQ